MLNYFERYKINYGVYTLQQNLDFGLTERMKGFGLSTDKIRSFLAKPKLKRKTM